MMLPKYITSQVKQRDVHTFLVALAMLMIAGGCATKGMLGGGPKDTTPPKVIAEAPENGSTNFHDDRISITFNEFVKLKDVSKNILISPPLSEQPDYKLRGKTLSVQFNQPLADSTTYCIFFGESLTDITEGNALNDYSFVFSTGSVIDSLRISGAVRNAFNGLPVENTLAGLYHLGDSLVVPDSIAMKQPPRYITRCTKEGAFRLGYIGPGRYLVFAINDLNNNYFYDPYSDAFAFTDTVVTLNYPPSIGLLTPKHDSTAMDTTAIVSENTQNDTISPIPHEDSVLHSPLTSPAIASFNLRLFKEEDSIQRITSRDRTDADAIRITYRYPLKNPQITILNADSIGPFHFVRNQSGDTLDLWLPSAVADTAVVCITEATGRCDTLKLLAKKREISNRRNRQQEPEHLQMKANISGSKTAYFNYFRLTFNQPVASTDTNKLLFIAGADTLRPTISPTDSTALRHELIYQLAQKTEYKLMIADSAFRSIMGLFSKKSNYNFTTATAEDYGMLKLKLTTNKPGTNHLIHWSDDKDKILRIYQFTADTLLTLPNLLPGKYKLKAILDSNGNKHWDTGSYMRSIQPENTIIRESLIEIRANWELEEAWELVF